MPMEVEKKERLEEEINYLKNKPGDAKKFNAGGCAESDLGNNMPVNAAELKKLKSMTA